MMKKILKKKKLSTPGVDSLKTNVNKGSACIHPHVHTGCGHGGYKAKKSLGQNFLKSEIALKKIVEAGEIKKIDVILEIGPGKGALTKKLLETGCKVIAVEKDEDLFGLLQEKFQIEIEEGKLTLLNSDILELNLRGIGRIFSHGLAEPKARRTEDLRKNRSQCPDKDLLLPTLSYKIIANIPYNITGAILKKFLTEETQPEMMVLMVQHEVAKRILAKDGKESILSISVKAYGAPKMIMKVPARYFSPAPAVDSAVIKISNISRDIFKERNTAPKDGQALIKDGQALIKDGQEELFWEIVKTGFAHKRKKLSKNLKELIPMTDENSIKLENKRAEELTLKDWINLTL